MTCSARMVWLPEQFSNLIGLPEHLRYANWDGGADFPSDPAEVAFYVQPLVQDVDIIRRPLPAMTNLQVVQALSAGVEGLQEEVRRLPGNVTLCNARGVHAQSTAELTLTLILASLRGIPELLHAQSLQVWKTTVFSSLYGRKVLIVGYGALGSAVEDLLAPFHCAVSRVARTSRSTPRGPVHAVAQLDGLIADADVIVLTTELTPSTRHLVGEDFLTRMSDGALLVNVARGAVIDSDALLRELRRGRIRAALDVTNPEPLPERHPLWEMPNVIITPHIGAFTPSLWSRLEILIRQQIIRFASGQKLANLVLADA